MKWSLAEKIALIVSLAITTGLIVVVLAAVALAHAGHYCGVGTHAYDWNSRERFVAGSGPVSAWHWHTNARQELTWSGWKTVSYPTRLCGPHS